MGTDLRAWWQQGPTATVTLETPGDRTCPPAPSLGSPGALSRRTLYTQEGVRSAAPRTPVTSSVPPRTLKSRDVHRSALQGQPRAAPQSLRGSIGALRKTEQKMPDGWHWKPRTSTQLT